MNPQNMIKTNSTTKKQQHIFSTFCSRNLLEMNCGEIEVRGFDNGPKTSILPR